MAQSDAAIPHGFAMKQDDERVWPGPTRVGALTVGSALHAGLISPQVYDVLVCAGLEERELPGLTVAEIAGCAGGGTALAEAIVSAAQVWLSSQGPDVRPNGSLDHEFAHVPIGSSDSADANALGVANEAGAPRDDVRLVSLLTAGVIGVRVYNVLITNGMTTVGDVRKHTVQNILSLKNFGQLSIKELSAAGVWQQTRRESSGEPLTRSDDPSRELGHHEPNGEGSVVEPVVETLAQLLVWIRRSVGTEDLDILSQRETVTLDEISRRRGVSRERVRQIESRATRRINDVVRRAAPHMPAGWHRQLAAGLASEEALFGTYLDLEVDTDGQIQAGRMVLRATIPTARRAQIFGQIVPGFWSNGSAEQIESRIRDLADFGPYDDEDFDEALSISGIDEVLARVLLASEESPLYHFPRARGWIRRVGPKRDACYLILSRVARPASAEALARMVEDRPRNLAAALERDERFQKLYGLRQWALASWDNSERGGRYRSTRDAMIDILTREGPMTFGELAKRVAAVHHVTSWAVTNNLENEVFGQMPDGRYAMTFQGASPFEEAEPALGSDVDPPTDPHHISFYVPVTLDLLRGSGIIVPRYVTWFSGLRRVPRKRTFEAADQATITLSRHAGSSTMSSLRTQAQSLRMGVDCVLRLTLDLAQGNAEVRAACPCHSDG